MDACRQARLLQNLSRGSYCEGCDAPLCAMSVHTVSLGLQSGHSMSNSTEPGGIQGSMFVRPQAAAASGATIHDVCMPAQHMLVKKTHTPSAYRQLLAGQTHSDRAAGHGRGRCMGVPSSRDCPETFGTLLIAAQDTGLGTLGGPDTTGFFKL